MFYLFLTDFVDTTLATPTFVFGSTPRVCQSIGIMNDDDFEGTEDFSASLMEHPDIATTIPGYALTRGPAATFTITDRNGKLSCLSISEKHMQHWYLKH